MAHPVIRIGAETNYAPYEFQDSRGHFVGVVADYLDIIRYKLGVRSQVKPASPISARLKASSEKKNST